MASKCTKVVAFKGSKFKGKTMSKVGGAVKADPGAMGLIDNEDGSFTVTGVDAAGQPTDISGVATLTATVDNPAVATVDPPSGMTGVVHAATVGTCTCTVTATWNDGSIGPFSAAFLITVAGGPAVGLNVNFGQPVPR